MKKAYRFLCRHRNPELLLSHRFQDQAGRCGLYMIGVCRFIHVFIKEKNIILNGGEVRVMSTRSKFSVLSVLAFALFAEPTFSDCRRI